MSAGAADWKPLVEGGRAFPKGGLIARELQGLVSITAALGERSWTLTVPSKLTSADLKKHLLDEGVVHTLDGLEVALHQGEASLDDAVHLELREDQVLHLRKAVEMVNVVASATGDAEGAGEDVYELVVPKIVTGIALREYIESTTSGALVPLAIFVAGCDEVTVQAVGDEELVELANDQAIIVQRAGVSRPTEAPAAHVEQQVVAHSSTSLLSKLRSRLLGRRAPAPAPTGFGVIYAANVAVKQEVVTCTARGPWDSCCVFKVVDPSFFEVGVELLADAPEAEADGVAGRWMLGVLPAGARELVMTAGGRRRLWDHGYFVTVCHGHPAKVHAPGMPHGTCGEDFPVLPGGLLKGQVLTLRWTAAAGPGTGVLTAMVDDGYAVTLPFSTDQEVQPCLVFGNRPAEVRVQQLQASGRAGGA